AHPVAIVSPEHTGPASRVATTMGTDKFTIPGHKAGVIIGPGGSQIKELKERTKAHITVSDDPDDPDKRMVIIIGKQDVRDAARDAINELLAASDRVDPSHALPPASGAGSSPAPADVAHTTRGSPQPYTHQASPTPPALPGGGFGGYGSYSSIPQGSAS